MKEKKTIVNELRDLDFTRVCGSCGCGVGDDVDYEKLAGFVGRIIGQEREETVDLTKRLLKEAIDYAVRADVTLEEAYKKYGIEQ